MPEIKLTVGDYCSNHNNNYKVIGGDITVSGVDNRIITVTPSKLEAKDNLESGNVIVSYNCGDSGYAERTFNLKYRNSTYNITYKCPCKASSFNSNIGDPTILQFEYNASGSINKLSSKNWYAFAKSNDTNPNCSDTIYGINAIIGASAGITTAKFAYELSYKGGPNYVYFVYAYPTVNNNSIDVQYGTILINDFNNNEIGVIDLIQFGKPYISYTLNDIGNEPYTLTWNTKVNEYSNSDDKTFTYTAKTFQKRYDRLPDEFQNACKFTVSSITDGFNCTISSGNITVSSSVRKTAKTYEGNLQLTYTYINDNTINGNINIKLIHNVQSLGSTYYISLTSDLNGTPISELTYTNYMNDNDYTSPYVYLCTYYKNNDTDIARPITLQSQISTILENNNDNNFAIVDFKKVSTDTKYWAFRAKMNKASTPKAYTASAIFKLNFIDGYETTLNLKHNVLETFTYSIDLEFNPSNVVSITTSDAKTGFVSYNAIAKYKGDYSTVEQLCVNPVISYSLQSSGVQYWSFINTAGIIQYSAPNNVGTFKSSLRAVLMNHNNNGVPVSISKDLTLNISASPVSYNISIEQEQSEYNQIHTLSIIDDIWAKINATYTIGTSQYYITPNNITITIENRNTTSETNRTVNKLNLIKLQDNLAARLQFTAGPYGSGNNTYISKITAKINSHNESASAYYYFKTIQPSYFIQFENESSTPIIEFSTSIAGSSATTITTTRKINSHYTYSDNVKEWYPIAPTLNITSGDKDHFSIKNISDPDKDAFYTVTFSANIPASNKISQDTTYNAMVVASNAGATTSLNMSHKVIKPEILYKYTATLTIGFSNPNNPPRIRVRWYKNNSSVYFDEGTVNPMIGDSSTTTHTSFTQTSDSIDQIRYDISIIETTFESGNISEKIIPKVTNKIMTNKSKKGNDVEGYEITFSDYYNIG